MAKHLAPMSKAQRNSEDYALELVEVVGNWTILPYPGYDRGMLYQFVGEYKATGEHSKFVVYGFCSKCGETFNKKRIDAIRKAQFDGEWRPKF